MGNNNSSRATGTYFCCRPTGQSDVPREAGLNCCTAEALLGPGSPDTQFPPVTAKHVRDNKARAIWLEKHTKADCYLSKVIRLFWLYTDPSAFEKPDRSRVDVDAGPHKSKWEVEGHALRTIESWCIAG
jgi:hypothetical protein